jgi:polysaccharide biosynthesis PFTS motif protein
MKDIHLLDFGDPNLKCFTNWYKKFSGTSKIAFVHHIKQAKKKFFTEYLYMDKYPLSFKSYLKFFFKSIKIYFFAFLELMVGNYKQIYCLAEVIQDLRAKEAPSYVIPDVIIFNESNSIVRPLFSYTLEDRGVSVQNFSFSVSAAPNLINETADNSPWPLNSWSSIFTFDEFHSEFIRGFRNLGNVKLQEIYEIPFYTDKNISLNFLDNRYIALFDILPVSGYFGASTLTDIKTNDWETWYQLIDFSMQISEELGIQLAYKPKKSLPKSAITFLNNYPKLVSLDEKISPHRIVEKSTLVITSAITTPLFIGNFYKIPTVVFCPSCKLLRSDPVLRKSQIARNKDELRECILRIV